MRASSRPPKHAAVVQKECTVMTSPMLSVIIPTYNRAALLRKTLESVFQQTFSDYEIIVVDDGSTDRTENTIEQLVKDKSAPGEMIRYFFQRNQGKSVAVNNGLSHARGEWVAFLDADDLWLPDKIEEQFRTLRQYAPESQACFTDAQFINNPAVQGTAFERAGKRYRDATGLLGSPTELIGRFWIYIQTLLLHSRVIAKVGEFDPHFWIGDDEDFIFRLSLHTRLCYRNSPLVLIDRTPHHPERLTEIALRRDYEVLQLRQCLYEKWLRISEGFGGELHAALRDHLRGVYSQQANWLLVNRRYAEARRAAALAARTQCGPGIAAKLCLATVAPALARKFVTRRSRSGHKADVRSSTGHAARPEGVGSSVSKGPA
jgi:glycosyltransferase involved in cell wall biosynthesis